MRDEFEGRLWADHHQSFSNMIDGALRALGNSVGIALAKLHEIEFDAPWKRDGKTEKASEYGQRCA